MSALKAFKAHNDQVSALNLQIAQIYERIQQIQGIASESAAPSRRASELKVKRRSILASFFLGRGDDAELSSTDKEIAEAEKAARDEAPRQEGAEAAIEELQRQANILGMQLNEIAKGRAALRHAALVEYAKDALPAYLAAARDLAAAYAELIGRCRAVDEMTTYGSGLYPVSFGFGSSFEVPGFPTFGQDLPKTLFDVAEQINTSKVHASQHIERVAAGGAS